MKKEKFKYNPKTLSYEKVEVSWQERLLKTALYVGPTLITSVVLAFLIAPLLKTNSKSDLEREVDNLKAVNTRMQDELDLATKVLDDIEARDEKIYRVLLNADKFPDEVRNMGTGGSDKYKNLEGYEASDLIIATSKKIELVKKKLYAQSLSFDELMKLAKKKEKMLASLPAIQPVNNADLHRMASGYGWRIDPIYKTKRMHWGMDFTADRGTEVYATGNGKVVTVETKAWGYGKSVIIDHGFGYKTRYAHLSKFNVKVGQTVKRGEVIGYVGSTGKSTANHLHYEVEKNGQKVNPVHYYHSDLSPEEYEKLIELSNQTNQSFD
jgi:murein DD-endopeptidase MepM/ murein hydrolase activator NlpD